MSKLFKTATAVFLSMVASPAFSGGFERAGQDIGTLFDEAPIVFSTSVTAVAPSFSYGTVTSPVFGSATGEKAVLDVVLPRVDAKIGWGSADCLGSYSIPYGAGAKYDEDWTGRLSVVEKKLEDRQFALTCSYAFGVGPGALRAIAGLSYEMATYEQTKNYSAFSGNAAFPGTVAGDRWLPGLELEGEGVGWRVGAAYEIPEYAVRASLMYYAAVDIDATGTVTDLPVTGVGRVPVVPVYAEATIPQSVELSLQSGIAPGWLAFGSVKWTDWSVWQRTDINQSGTGTNITYLNSYFEDGWTFNVGVGHQFDERLSGLVSVTYDQGVGTGWTEHTDTWTLAAGAKYSLTENLDLVGGIAGTWIAGGSVTLPDPSMTTDYTAAWDANWSISGRLGLKAHF